MTHAAVPHAAAAVATLHLHKLRSISTTFPVSAEGPSTITQLFTWQASSARRFAAPTPVLLHPSTARGAGSQTQHIVTSTPQRNGRLGNGVGWLSSHTRHKNTNNSVVALHVTCVLSAGIARSSARPRALPRRLPAALHRAEGRHIARRRRTEEVQHRQPLVRRVVAARCGGREETRGFGGKGACGDDEMRTSAPHKRHCAPLTAPAAARTRRRCAARQPSLP